MDMALVVLVGRLRFLRIWVSSFICFILLLFSKNSLFIVNLDLDDIFGHRFLFSFVLLYSIKLFLHFPMTEISVGVYSHQLFARNTEDFCCL